LGALVVVLGKKGDKEVGESGGIDETLPVLPPPLLVKLFSRSTSR